MKPDLKNELQLPHPIIPLLEFLNFNHDCSCYGHDSHAALV